MSQIINKIPVAVNERSEQNLSYSAEITSDFGRMDVVYCNSDIVPGDDVNLKIDGFLRGAPMPAPTYGKIDVNVRVFFVPHRILTSRPAEAVSGSFSWDDYITGVSSNSHPYACFYQLIDRLLSASTNYIGNDYLRDLRRLYSEFRLPDFVYNYNSGVTPTPTGLVERTNLWRYAAYQRVWWDWYRDSALIDESLIRNYLPLLAAGQATQAAVNLLMTPRYCCWKKDYFTVAKLNPQSGASSSSVPSSNYSLSSTTVPQAFYNPSDVIDSSGNVLSTPTTVPAVPVQWIRAANALQKYLERNNLAGSRLMERFLARFGNAPSPLTLDMAEYLGGSSRTLQIGDITSNMDNVAGDQQFSNSFATPDGTYANGTIQGQLGGKCASDASSGSISYHAKEFGTLIAIQTLVPHVMYRNGLSRELTRGCSGDRFEYFTPEMENLGYQPLYNKELDYRGTSSDANIFGFTPRYSDYKTAQGIVAGDFVLQGTNAGMDSWYLSREFGGASAPSLTSSFTDISPYPRLQLDRIFSIPGQVGEYDHFNGFYHCDVKLSRPMSGSSLPSLDEDLGQSGKVVDVQNGGVRM